MIHIWLGLLHVQFIINHFAVLIKCNDLYTIDVCSTENSYNAQVHSTFYSYLKQSISYQNGKKKKWMQHLKLLNQIGPHVLCIIAKRHEAEWAIFLLWHVLSLWTQSLKNREGILYMFIEYSCECICRFEDMFVWAHFETDYFEKSTLATC